MIELSPETQKLPLVLLLRVWHGTPILVIISILAYFCFVEELLVLLLPPRPLLFLLKLTYTVYAWYAKFTWLTGGPWRHCCAGYIAALLMYPGPLLILDHHKHGYVMTWHPRVKLKHYYYIYRCLLSELAMILIRTLHCVQWQEDTYGSTRRFSSSWSSSSPISSTDM